MLSITLNSKIQINEMYKVGKREIMQTETTRKLQQLR